MTEFETWPYANKTSFILLELTKNKALCNKIIELYKKCAKNKPNDNDNGIFKVLETHNQTDALKLVELECDMAHIKINKVIWPNIDATNAIQLINRPRGYFIIVNNVEKSVDELEREEKSNLVSDEEDKNCMLDIPREEMSEDDSKNKLPSASGLRLETERFKDLMTQFNFKVLNWGGLSIAEMKEKIAKLKKEDLNDHEAIALMVVTHGQDEEILGSDACNLPHKLHFKKRFNTLKPEFEQSAIKKIENDRAPIKDIVELFKDDKFSKLYAKLLFFTCCRIKTNTEPVQVQKTKVIETKSLVDYKDDNLIVCYTCLEGDLV